MTQKKAATEKSRGGVKALFSSGEKEEENEAPPEEKEPSKRQTAVKKTGATANTKSAGKKRTGQKQPESQAPAPPAPAPQKELLTEKFIRFALPERERSRVLAFIENPNTNINTFSDICRKALTDYLDKEEPMLREIEKAVERVRQKKS